MKPQHLVYRLIRLPAVWEKKHFTFQDIWDYLDLSRTEYKLLDKDWGKQKLRIVVNEAEFEVTFFFEDGYKDGFVNRPGYEDEELYETQFSQPITDLNVTVKL